MSYERCFVTPQEIDGGVVSLLKLSLAIYKQIERFDWDSYKNTRGVFTTNDEIELRQAKQVGYERGNEKLRLLKGDEEMDDIEGVVTVRAISRGFVFGFQGCISADEIRLCVSIRYGVSFVDVSVLVGTQLLQGNRP